MKRLILYILLLAATIPALCQAPAVKYQSGIIVAVAKHPETKIGTSPRRYEITLRVGDMIYVVLYTAPAGSTVVEYRVGSDLPVLVGSKAIKYPDVLGITRESPILRKRPATAQD